MTEPAMAAQERGLTGGGVGEELARAREARGLELAEVAQQLKFAPRQLEALEQERFELLPGATFVRGMVRSYARLLKIDAEPLVGRIAERVAAPDANRLAARYSQPVPFSTDSRRSTLLYLGLSLGVLAAAGAMAYQWYHEHNALNQVAAKGAAPQSATATEPGVAQPAAPPAAAEPKAPPRVAEAKPPARVAEAKPPAHVAEPRPAVPPTAKLETKATVEKTAAAADNAKTIAPAPVPAGPVHRLVLRCDVEAWLEVKDGAGRLLVSSLNPAGAERVVRGRGPFTFVIGNASRVALTYDDKPVDLQPYIKVEVARFTLP
jgi:cytoskeleton protein RodZ